MENMHPIVEKNSATTFSLSAKDIEKKWFIVDAKGQVLGRLASQIAYILRGKHKPTFSPHLDCGDRVIVINAAHVVMTGNKMQEKEYFHHTSFFGGVKRRRPTDILAKNPIELVEIAVKGMLPKNRLGAEIFRSLYVYPQATHKQEAQKPQPLPVRTAVK
jgi:large subunit ribosomal protein L13